MGRFARLILIGFGLTLAEHDGGVSSVQAHDLSLTIKDCTCDKNCYTDEVTDLHCDNDHATFKSHGLPDISHPLMVGIEGSNQQFPSIHNHETRIPLTPELGWIRTKTEEGAIGIAVNGVPIFSPDTQGPVQASTGRPVSALAAGELDECGGHAGRGDDYHYHIAPRCLIEELGKKRVENDKQPIGYSMDGFPILALGWFDPKHDIESQLDKCRGIKDAKGHYFYNVEHKPDWDVLDCFSGSVQRGFDHDRWAARKDMAGGDMVGIPIKFHVTSYQYLTSGKDACHVMQGTVSDLQVLKTDQTVTRINNKKGTLFYCNPGCYGQFFEADDVPGAHGRTVYFERPTSTCPDALKLAKLPMFEVYEGPAQSRKGPPPKGR